MSVSARMSDLTGDLRPELFRPPRDKVGHRWPVPDLVLEERDRDTVVDVAISGPEALVEHLEDPTGQIVVPRLVGFDDQRSQSNEHLEWRRGAELPVRTVEDRAGFDQVRMEAIAATAVAVASTKCPGVKVDPNRLRPDPLAPVA